MSAPKSRDEVVFELAALMREAFAEVAIEAHEMGVQGSSQQHMLSRVVPAAEPFVQTFMRKVVVK